MPPNDLHSKSLDHATAGQPHAESGARGRPAKTSGSRPRAAVASHEHAHTETAAVEFDLDAPEWYLNRELTWLEFNRRVLHEAQDSRTPLLERVKFLAIVHANLDEFFMKRIGGLKQQMGAGIQALSIDGRTPAQQIAECREIVLELFAAMKELERELHGQLAEKDVRIVRFSELKPKQQTALSEYYRTNIFPLVTPLGIDPAHPFPFISNLSLNLLIEVRPAGAQESTLVRIKVPTGSGAPRFVKVDGENLFVPMEDLVAEHLDLLFPGLEVLNRNLFRVTRNAMVEKSEDTADDLLELIESEVRERKFAPIVRLELTKKMSAIHRGMLAAELGLDEAHDVFEQEGLMAGRNLFQIAGLDLPELKDSPCYAADHPVIADAPNIFHAIREHAALLVCHPYESFATTVEKFLADASRDPKVLAIKMTLYRTAANSKIIEYLMQAARNGKHVAVVVELKARFDEAANIHWADYLEEEGIHVSYGLVGLKIHSKIIFVIRQDYDGLRRYAHIGTGNYHAGTARLYCDYGLFTCDPAIGEDLTELFNHLTSGQVPRRKYKKLLPAPTVLKQSLIDMIEREIAEHAAGRAGLIQMKMNALEDRDITRALYRASQAGVRVDLIVRDTCRLRPGVPGLSDNVHVISIVGRFLEHGRIYYFRNGGAEQYFIGSADCMTRNLESRVEVVTPVDHPALREQLRQILDLQLQDRRNAWDMQPDGSYVQRTPPPDADPRGSQELQLDARQPRRG
jgi:polyphosphate kinase